ncbi:lysylphosphatidylglycerol synthase domain-containing protein [Mumia sp. DW29H23]|uniref:lysylphosphatidylglycerol synthase domain-containing protein n=1 Tax=Mumia sp. DW29H23 TaxID=3421241 RepID=UPI003D69371B
MGVTADVRRFARPVLLLGLSLAAGWIIIGLVGAVDWQAVGSALGRLNVWQLALLVAVVVVRQILNAWPLAIFIEGLGLPRAVVNDQASILMCTLAPPPSDLLIRMTMFSGWGIDLSRGLAGVVMNTVSFYVVRWAAPVIGFVLVLTDRFDSSFATGALAGGLAALTLVVAIRIIASGAAAARWVGRSAGRAARVVRRSVDPEAWAQSVATFRAHIADKLRRGFPRSLLALLAMMVCDATALVLAVRFVGVPSDVIPTVEIVAAYFLTYPLTMLPVFGIGALDAAAVAIMVAYAGIAYEAPFVAALIVWRAVTIGTPLTLGAFSVLLWRRISPVSDPVARAAPEPG